MSDSIEAVSSSLTGLIERYEVITHNLANSDTAGYKRRVVSVSESTAPSTDPSTTTLTNETAIDFTQGNVIRTGRPLDLAVSGKNAFFVIETPEGPLYTRNGVFRVNAQGQLVDAAGQTVSGEGGPIVIPVEVGPTRVHIARGGEVSGNDASIGKLKIVEFDEPQELIQVGLNCYRAPETLEPKASADATVHQGFQENSNVSVVKELVDLITVTRMYEATLKSVQAQDESLNYILQVAMA